MKEIDLSKLSEPFIPKWRVLSTKGGKAVCVPYLDARQVQQRLDSVCTPLGWQNEYDATNGLASISILSNDEWVRKSDVGVNSNIEKEKGRASDAFKRAAVLWSIGRDLHEIAPKVLDTNGKQALTSKGVILWTGAQLSNYINGLNESIGLIQQLIKLEDVLSKTEEFQNIIKKLYGLIKRD